MLAQYKDAANICTRSIHKYEISQLVLIVSTKLGET